VDDGGTGESARAGSLWMPRESANMGFCRAVNRGMEEAAGDWPVIFNKDARKRFLA